MSSTSTPIAPDRFAEAIKELPLANLHFKAAEIRNSISHLESSNHQLEQFAEDGDKDCAEAIEENQVVVRRMEERIYLLKREVECRGFRWGEDDRAKGDIRLDGHGDSQTLQEHASRSPQAEYRARPYGGSLGDEELARRVMERMNRNEIEDDDGHSGGLHL